MILFDRSTKSPSTELERWPAVFPAELTKVPSAELIWKDPTDVLRGEEVLTVEGWQQAAESGWQLYHRFDTPYGLTVKGSGIRRIMLPRIYWPDGRPAVRVREPHDDFYDRAAPEELYEFIMAPLDVLQEALEGMSELTACCEDGVWRTAHGLILPATRSGKVKRRRARMVVTGSEGDEIFKFKLYDFGLNGYGVDLRLNPTEQTLEPYTQGKLQPREGF